MTDEPDFTAVDQVGDETSDGIGEAFGPYYNVSTYELYVWNYQNDDNDFSEGSYTAWVGQYDSKKQDYYVFVDSSDIAEYSGAV